jgi:mannitol-specific phosphotransferase system IIBC component
MTSWRGDVGTSGVLGGTLNAIIGIAAAVVAVIALANSQRHEALLAIGIAAVVVFVLAMVTLFTRKQINLRRAKRYLREERAVIADMKAALQKVQKDLEAPPEQRDLLADHMEAVRRLVARIRVTSGINVCATRVADDISNHRFRPDEPEASHDTVTTALIDCDKAEYGYGEIDERLKSATVLRQRVPKSARS